MNLKEQITKTDTLKNDLKLAKQKINDKILSGGGTRANTISEVPDKISNMLGAYNKIAIKQCNVEFNAEKLSLSIPFDVDFTPTRILARMTGMEETTLDSKYTTELNTANGIVFRCYGQNIKYSKSSKRVNINIESIGFNPDYRFFIKEITLIG